MGTIDRAKIYADLTSLNIELKYDDIPTPGYIQDRTFECNTANWKVDKYSLEVTQELGRIRRLFKIDKFNFDAKKRQALTNNEKIKKIPTGKEREAAVEELLENDLRTLLDLENEMDALKDLMGAIKTVQDNIKETSSGIRVLVRTMESMINRLNVGTKEDSEVASLHKTFAELDDLEKEIAIDGVESSSETVQDEPGDELSEAAHKTGTEDSGQGASVAPSAEGDDTLASFLVDDSDETENQSSDDDETEENAADEPTQAEATAAAPTNKEPARATGSTPKTVTSHVDMDLSEIGINIDTGDITDSPTPEKAPTEAKSPAIQGVAPSVPLKTEAAEKKKEDPPGEKKKEAPPSVAQSSKKVETPKKDITDIDLDDILNSLD